jgi:chromosome transmission fidelity protein 8
MPIVTVYPPTNYVAEEPCPNPFPELLQTPNGYAIVEIQGTIHTPSITSSDEELNGTQATRVGNIVFPLYNENSPKDTSWMNIVYLYVGKHQRLTGQVKKLPKAMAVLKRKEANSEDLQIVEIIKYKIVFSQRPEPVGEE